MTATGEEITKRLEPSIRNFFLIDCIPIPREVSDSLVEAIQMFARQCHLRTPVSITIAANPIEINIGPHTLTMKLGKGTIGLTVLHNIFFDINELIKLHKNIQIACFLEEFVHGVMAVNDELTTSHVVAALYGGVKIVNGQYVAHEYD